MYLDHRISVKIERILNMIDMSALLLDSTGSVLYPEGDARTFTLPEMLLQNPTMPLVYGSFTLIGTDEEQPVFICLCGDSEETKKCAVLCAELINMMLHNDMRQTNRSEALRMILRGEVTEGDEEGLASDHGIALKKQCCVLYLYLPDVEAEKAVEMLETGLDEERELITEVGRHALAIVKEFETEEEISEMEEYANAIKDSFLTETGNKCIIGISEPRDSISSLHEAYDEARHAINVGRVYHPEREIFLYSSLLLERFLDEVSGDIGASYNAKIFNRKTARLFNEEMLTTIVTFFDNSLNLSETARKLYIHRNTLVYRLEKVQKEIGIDLRNFDDAVTFKMLLLLGKNNTNRKNRV